MDPLVIEIADLVLVYAMVSGHSVKGRVRVWLTDGFVPSLFS